MTRRYAEHTTVTVQKSKEELRRILQNYGATDIIDMSLSEGHAIQTQLYGRWLQFSVPKPDPEQFRAYTYRELEYERTDAECQAQAEKEYRRRWRVLIILVKAKLEAVIDNGLGTTFESQFLPDMLLPDGSTIGDHAEKEVNNLYLNGTSPIRGLLPVHDD